MATISPDELRERQRRDWQAASTGWRKWGKHVMKGLQPASDQLIKNTGISTGNSVLDLATGTGELALTVARIVGPKGRVTAVDLSPEMLEIAKERATSQGANNVTFQVGDGENLSMFENNMFDAVLCRFGLMLMPNPIKALQGFLRVLKSGKKASVSVWGPPERTPFIALPMKVVAKHVPEVKPPSPGTPGGPFGIPTQDMLEDFFTKAGFTNIYSKVTEITGIEIDSPEKHWQLTSEVSGSLILLLSKLSEEKKQAIRNDWIEQLKQMFPNGHVKLPGELIVGVGSKP